MRISTRENAPTRSCLYGLKRAEARGPPPRFEYEVMPREMKREIHRVLSRQGG
jgi:hypothetical protein